MANFRWLPSSFTYFDNFKEAWKMVNWSVCFGNSFLITVLVVVGSLLFNSLAGYAFARLRFKGRDLLFMTILLGMMVSPQSIIIPQYVMMRSVPLTGGNNLMGSGGTGLLDSYVSLIVPFLSGAFGIFCADSFIPPFQSRWMRQQELTAADRYVLIFTFFFRCLRLFWQRSPL